MAKTKCKTIDDVRDACLSIGDTLNDNFKTTGDVKVAQTAISAYSTAIKCASIQLIHKKLTGIPAEIGFLAD